MVLTFSGINEAFTNLKPSENENETLEHYMAKETMSNFNDSSIEAFTNYQNGNGNGSNLAQIVTDEQFVKPRKKAKKKKNNKSSKNNRNPYQNVVRQPMPQQQFLPQEYENTAELSSDEDEVEENIRNVETAENTELRQQMNELDTKLNMLINNLNKQNKDEEKKEEKSKIDVENSNIYDIILFVIFGLFILLLLESLTKLISKNILKYEPTSSIKAAME